MNVSVEDYVLEVVIESGIVMKFVVVIELFVVGMQVVGIVGVGVVVVLVFGVGVGVVLFVVVVGVMGGVGGVQVIVDWIVIEVRFIFVVFVRVLRLLMYFDIFVLVGIDS